MGRENRDVWRGRVERLLASGMRVHEWCELNHVGEPALYGWLAKFRETDPGLFGGEEVLAACSGKTYWFEAVRKARSDSTALARAATASPSFAVVDTGGLAPAPARPAGAGGASISVSIGRVVVSVPAGSDAATLSAVLTAVASL